MQTYSNFRPTGFDPRGLALDDQQDWLVLPVGRNRDSGALDESNFAMALESLGGESEDVEVHRFGHWACGWFEIIIVRPDSPAQAIAEDIERALENYPVLSDEDFSRREWEDAQQDWSSWGRTDFKLHIGSLFNLNYSTMEILHDSDSDALWQFYLDHARDYVPLNIRSFDCSRDELAAFLRQQRNRQTA